MRSEKELADKHAEEHKDFLNVPAIKLGPQTWTREMSQNAGVSPTAAGSVPQAAHAPTMGAEKRKTCRRTRAGSVPPIVASRGFRCVMMAAAPRREWRKRSIR